MPGADLHPVLQRIYRHRGVSRPEQLDYSLQRLLPLDKLKGLDDAVQILLPAVLCACGRCA